MFPKDINADTEIKGDYIVKPQGWKEMKTYKIKTNSTITKVILL